MDLSAISTKLDLSSVQLSASNETLFLHGSSNGTTSLAMLPVPPPNMLPVAQNPKKVIHLSLPAVSATQHVQVQGKNMVLQSNEHTIDVWADGTSVSIACPRRSRCLRVSSSADAVGVTFLLHHSFGPTDQESLLCILDLDYLSLLALLAALPRWADDPTSVSFRDLVALGRLYALPHRPTPRVALVRVPSTALPVQTLLADPVDWSPQDPHVRSFFAVGVDPFCSLLWSPAVQDDEEKANGHRSILGSVASAVASTVVASWWGGSAVASPDAGSESAPLSLDIADEERMVAPELRVPTLLADSSNRVATSLVTTPCGTLALVGDCLGRVSLILVQTCTVLHMWKGYRQARFTFSPTLEIVLQAPHRSLLEVWEYPGTTCRAALILPPHIHILPHVSTHEHITAYAWDTQQSQLMRLAPAVSGGSPSDEE